jgi:hypothetical protein
MRNLIVSNNLVHFRRALYQLKREYGFPAALYRTVVGDTNLQTGLKSTTRIKYAIKRCVILPVNTISLGFYSSALLKAARQFSYGGFQDQDIKNVLVDGRDLPKGFEILQEDYLVYQHKKFEMVKIAELEQGIGYHLIVNGLRGMVPNEVHEASVFQTLRFTGVLDGS